MALEGSLSLRVRNREDVLVARQEAKRFAGRLPFAPEDLGRIEVAAAELASNMVKHAGGGRITLNLSRRPGQDGVQLVAEDHGAGIPDLERALSVGFSTKGTLGTGLPAVREMMDRFEIVTRPGEGTRVEVEKWLR